MTAAIHHAPLPGPDAGPAPDVAALEGVLADWFERPVVLLASARTGLQLLLEAGGLGRYRAGFWTPQYLSRCVVNAVTHNAMPLGGPDGADGTLLYHQYGFEQRGGPVPGLVVEDLAHAFYARAGSGARRWRSDAAIFSLPKFFATGGLGGGVVIADERRAAELRERVAAGTRPDAGVRTWMRSVYDGVRRCPPGETCPEDDWLEAVYELLFRFRSPDADDLAGVPDSQAGLAAVGQTRRERVEVFRSCFPAEPASELWGPDGPEVPYALPWFGPVDGSALDRVDAALATEHVVAGVYHVDVRRDMARPEWRRCVLLPCHQDIPLRRFEALCELVGDAAG